MRKRSDRNRALLVAAKTRRPRALAQAEGRPERAIIHEALAACLGRRIASGRAEEALADLAVLHLQAAIAETRQARQRLELTLQQLER